MEEKKTEFSRPKRNAPSSITVNVRPRIAFEEKKVKKNQQIPKGLFIGLMAVGALLVVGIIVVGVLLLTQPKAAAVEVTTPAATQTAEPQATPSATPEPTPTATPMPTTPPEVSDDLSSIFEAPTNPILDNETQGQ